MYVDFDCSYVIKDNWIWKGSYDNLRQLIKIHWYHFANKGLFCQQYGCCFSSYEWIWEVHHKESWDQRTNAFELWCWRRLLSPLNSKEIKPVNPKGNQPWIFIGRTDAEAKVPVFWPPDAKNWHWKRAWCSESLKAGEEGNDRGLDDQMASSTQRTWIQANSGRWWRAEELAVVQFIVSWRVRHVTAIKYQQEQCD